MTVKDGESKHCVFTKNSKRPTAAIGDRRPMRLFSAKHRTHQLVKWHMASGSQSQLIHHQR